jgi:hypothetical protein
MEIILRKRMAGKAGGNPLLKQAANGLLKQEVKQPNAGLLNQPGEPPQFYARAGASLSLSSSSSSSEGECEGEPPHIPTLSEFLACAEFAAKGVPEDYLRGKFAWFEGNNAWLDQHKRLKKYAVLVCSWWETDRVAWLAKKKAEPGDLVELRARLTVEKDPEKRAKLREDLKRLEG